MDWRFMKNISWDNKRFLCLIFLGLFACQDYQNDWCGKYLQDKEYKKAIKECTKSIERTKDDKKRALYFGLRGYAYLGNGQIDLSLADCTKALDIDPKDISVHITCGRAYAGKGEYDMAIEYINRAIEMNQGKYQGHASNAFYERGNAYMGKKQFDLAILDYSKAIELKPHSARFYNARGAIYALKGENEKANSDFRKAITVNPQFLTSYYNMARLFSRKGNTNDACRFLMKATDLGYDQWNDIKQEKDFDSIRNALCFKKILSLRYKAKISLKKIYNSISGKTPE